MMSITSRTMITTVSARLNHSRCGRSVGRFGSRAVSASDVPVELAWGSSLVWLMTRARVAGPPVDPAEAAATEPPAPRAHCTPAAVRRRRSESPMNQAKPSASSRPTISDGTMGAKISLGSSCSAEAARAVGPPHGTMFSVPLIRPATQVSTTGDISSRR